MSYSILNLVIDKFKITLQDFRNILNASIGDIKLRGGTEKTDKTMLNSLIPALDEINKLL